MSLSEVFQRKKPLIAYITAGDPHIKYLTKTIRNVAKAGADIIEIGLPFSDSLADGPVIQESHHRALRAGTTTASVLAHLKKYRKKITVPLVIMTSANLLLAYGLKKFFEDAVESGIEGLIIPDLPPEEARDFVYLSEHYNVPIIFLASTLSSIERLKLIASQSKGFIYVISSAGITGERAELALDAVQETIYNLRLYAQTPIAVGFGVSTPEQAASVAKLGDGVIVGSAIVSRLKTKPGSAYRLIKDMVKRMKA